EHLKRLISRARINSLGRWIADARKPELAPPRETARKRRPVNLQRRGAVGRARRGNRLRVPRLQRHSGWRRRNFVSRDPALELFVDGRRPRIVRSFPREERVRRERRDARKTDVVDSI